MPRYEYACRSCGHRFTADRSVDERDAPIACPECGNRFCRRAEIAMFMTTTRSGPSSTGTTGGQGACTFG